MERSSSIGRECGSVGANLEICSIKKPRQLKRMILISVSLMGAPSVIRERLLNYITYKNNGN